MPARRSPRDLKLAEDGLRAIDPVAGDTQLVGLGLDWAGVPGVLDEAGQEEWNRLVGVFAGDSGRFR